MIASCPIGRTVPSIRFPFWLLVSESPEPPMAFSSVKKMEAFLVSNKTKIGIIRLVNRYTIKTVVKHLVKTGHQFICYDPNEDGTGGHSVPIESVEKDYAL